MAKEEVPSRQLWQVPVFLLGVTVLVAYLLVRPAWTDPLVRADVRLDRARKLWEERDANVRKIYALLQDYLDLSGPQANRAGEAHLVWGATLARAARRANPADAQSLRKQAWEHLREAQNLRDGLRDDDLSLLRAAMGEVGYHVGHDRRWVQHWLRRYQDFADDRAEACRLLTLLCLESDPPQLAEAIQANEQLRQLPLLGEDVLGPARLQGGELLLKLRRFGEGRKLLEKIGKDAAPELLARARMLRAESLQGESRWAEAAAVWQEMLEEGRRPLDAPGRVLYQLGLCHRRLDQREEAIRVWREAQTREGVTAASAALGLAELTLTDAGPDLVELLRHAVRGVDKPESWQNQYATLPQARDLFEQACAVLRQKSDYVRALEVCEAYRNIAVVGRAAWQSGLTRRDWARAVAKGDRDRAVSLMKQAGEAFQEAADSFCENTERAERLWLSAEGFFDGGEPGRAVTALERFLKLEGHTPERLGEGWYRLALAQEELKHPIEAEAAYRRSMQYRGRYACRARYRLSQAELARGKTDLAIDMLDQNRLALQLEHDDEALENTLNSLGHLLFLQKVRNAREKDRDPAAVRAILEVAVTRYPTGPVRGRGRFELAETYRVLADQENRKLVETNTLTSETRGHYLEQRRSWLMKAAEQFQILNQSLLNDTEIAKELTPPEQIHVAFSVAECRFNLGDYPLALKLYEELSERYRNRPERLSALGGMARCHAAQREFKLFRTRLEEIRLALPDVDEQTRKQWEAWLNIAGKGL